MPPQRPLMIAHDRAGRRLDCPLCGGRGAVSLRRGRTVRYLAKCFRCAAPYRELARALGIPDDDRKARRPRRSPIRTRNAVEEALAPLLAAQAHLQHALRPWLEYLVHSGEVRWETTLARELRQLATTIGPSDFSWDLLEEAAQRERRARLLIFDLDADLAHRNASLAAFLKSSA